MYSSAPLKEYKLSSPYLRNFCVVCVDSRACEAGVEHPELESALWASIAFAVKALEHVARNVDYRALCEGLARLDRIVGALLREAARSDVQSQTERQVKRWMFGEGGGGVH